VPRALVIGSSSGIGLAIARRLVATGWAVTGIARRASPLDAAGYVHLRGDVRDPDFPALLVEAFAADVDLCVYCAGIGRELDLADLAPEPDVFATNLLGAVATAEVAIPRMIAAGCGHLIAISSQADRLIDRHAPSYAASKAGLSSYLEGLALACRPRGVFVTNLRLGFVDTDLSRDAGPRPFLVTADRVAALVERCLRRRPIRVTFPRRLIPLVWLANLPARLRVWLS
jgi:NAD(P)-dependent dehydrogenase (short-subunit alcohol dehydrogenase family)